MSSTQPRTTIVIKSYLKTSDSISNKSRILSFSLHVIPERDCTPLQCFYKGCIQSNQQLDLSRLMHSIYCGSAVFPYQALERTAAQETLIGCAGLYNINLKALNIQPVYTHTHTHTHTCAHSAHLTHLHLHLTRPELAGEDGYKFEVTTGEKPG
jgi:hypothetical protein